MLFIAYNYGVFVDLAFDTEGDLIEHLRTAKNVFGGIVFLFNSDMNLPKNITYKIRLRAEMIASKDPDWLTDHLYPSTHTIGPRKQNDMYGGEKPGRLIIQYFSWLLVHVYTKCQVIILRQVL